LMGREAYFCLSSTVCFEGGIAIAGLPVSVAKTDKRIPAERSLLREINMRPLQFTAPPRPLGLVTQLHAEGRSGVNGLSRLSECSRAGACAIPSAQRR